MAHSTFAFWKQPGSKEIFTISKPYSKAISESEIADEGFIFFPYKKNKKGIFIGGTIVQTSVLNFPSIFKKVNKIPTSNNSENYTTIVSKAISDIIHGDLKKVVLARSFSQYLPDTFNLKTFFESLCNMYEHAFVYCIGLKNEIWIGATPEVFLQKTNDQFLTYALAGTKSLISEYTFGDKEKIEQQFVKNYIVDLLKNNNAEAIEISELTEINAGNLKHLMNEIKFKTPTSFDIIHNLHPTPAVCGTPLNLALDFINENENFDREFYSGFLGPVFKNGDFSFWVNLRCAKISDDVITLFAGAGITKNSLPESEWQETEKKMDTLRSIL